MGRDRPESGHSRESIPQRLAREFPSVPTRYDLAMPRRSKKKSTPREFDVVIERDSEGWLVATVPALRGCHTQAKSQDELVIRIREAIQLRLEVGGEPAVRLDFVGIQRVRVA